MSWSEAFARAFRAVVALVVLYIIAIVLIVLGIAIAINGGGAEIGIGLLFILAGVGLFLLSGLAVFIKVMTDALAEHSSPGVVTEHSSPDGITEHSSRARPPSEEVSPLPPQEPPMQDESQPVASAPVDLIRQLQTQVISLHSENPNDENLLRIRRELAEVWMQVNSASSEEDIQHSAQRFEQLQEEFNQLKLDSRA